jgi:hypothetical protein
MAKVREYIGESTVDFRQLAKLQAIHWGKYSRLSPIGENKIDFATCRETILIQIVY